MQAHHTHGDQLELVIPAPFARALLDDLRKPADDLDDPSTDPEQLQYEARFDAAVADWTRQLDGPGDRTLVVGAARAEFEENVRESMLEGLTSRLYDGTTDERRQVVAALAGWTEAMRQIEEKAR